MSPQLDTVTHKDFHKYQAGTTVLDPLHDTSSPGAQEVTPSLLSHLLAHWELRRPMAASMAA